MKFYYVTIIFDRQIFDNEKTAHFKIFKIWNEMNFGNSVLQNDTFFKSFRQKLCYNRHKYEIEKKNNIAYSTACNLKTVCLSGLNLD